MARLSFVLALLMALAIGQAAAQGCIRYQAMFGLKNKADLPKVTAIVARWMKDDCKGYTAFQQGGAGSTSPTAFALRGTDGNNVIADYGLYSDWNSLDDIKACFAAGFKSGNLPEVRKFFSTSSRVAYRLPSCGAGGGTRFMFNYRMKAPGAASCATARDLHDKIAASLGVTSAGAGCDVTGGDGKVYGPTATTDDYGGFADLPSMAGVTTFLTSTKPDVTAARTTVRALGTTVSRVAIPLGGAGGGTAKERAAEPLKLRL